VKRAGKAFARTLPMMAPDVTFMLLGTAYVVFKWTVGLWAFRRAKAYVATRRDLRTMNPVITS